MTTSLVTGAAAGLGLAIATTLAERGDVVTLLDRDAGVGEVAADLRGRGYAVRGIVADLTDDDDVVRAIDEAGFAAGGLDVLVNNAGITRDARLANLTVEGFGQVLDVNLLAPMRLTRLLESRLADGSAVVNISSRAALGNFGQANYVTSKSGLTGFTRALALQWAPRVRVNAVAPGLIDSAMTRAMPSEVLAALVERVPAQRMGTAEDVARAVAFLASPDAAYVTGQVLTVCGGRSVAP
jgi:NAD(P)-dependent dehydrogenase (short-subunit alcohol dehydrogenase family)